MARKTAPFLLEINGMGVAQGELCKQRDTDRYGRLVATCAVGTLDLGRAMVESGHAVAFRKYSNIYVPDEEGARVSRRGIWDGSFQMPDDWRRTHRP